MINLKSAICLFAALTIALAGLSSNVRAYGTAENPISLDIAASHQEGMDKLNGTHVETPLVTFKDIEKAIEALPKPEDIKDEKFDIFKNTMINLAIRITDADFSECLSISGLLNYAFNDTSSKLEKNLFSMISVFVLQRAIELKIPGLKPGLTGFNAEINPILVLSIIYPEEMAEHKIAGFLAECGVSCNQEGCERFIDTLMEKLKKLEITNQIRNNQSK